MNQIANAPMGGYSMDALSRLLLPGRGRTRDAQEIKAEKFDELLELADLNHVTVRALGLLAKRNDDIGERAAKAQAAELARIENAVSILSRICAGFKEAGHDVTVIKSLDHWPDLGSDLDLFTTARPEQVLALMKEKFGAETAERSWGDRLAGKWNFVVPGMPELIECHVGRLGQTGEQASIAAALPARAQRVNRGEHWFTITGASDRLMISTLQRMYRHFFFRLCDIVDTVELCDAHGVDYDDLERSARKAGIWEGVATFMAIVSDYAEWYRGTGLGLPHGVRAAARFGGSEIFFRDSFIRVPIMPQSASLYGLQLSGMIRKGELQNSARLTLLPWLATAAAVGQKITGSDKGIW